MTSFVIAVQDTGSISILVIDQHEAIIYRKNCIVNILFKAILKTLIVTHFSSFSCSLRI